MNRWVAAVSTTALMTSGLSACSLASKSTPDPLPGKHVTRAEFNGRAHMDIWPLTVDQGTLSCLNLRPHEKTGRAVVFTTEDGTRFALNGTAWNTRKYHDLRGILARGRSGQYKDATWLIGAGLRLCPGYEPGF